MNDIIKQIQIEGTAIVRLGWEYKTTEEVKTYPEEKLGVELGDEYEPFTKYKVDIKKVNTRVLKNQPTAVLRKSEDVWIDPDCKGNIEEADFVIDTHKASYNELIQDKTLSNLDALIHQTSMLLSDTEGIGSSTAFYKDKELNRKYIIEEYWGKLDVNDDGILEDVLVVYCGDVILKVVDNPYPNKKLPFVMFHYDKKPFDVYGEPLSASIEDYVKVKTGLIRGILDNLVKGNVGQKIVRTGAFSGSNKVKFANGQDCEIQGDPAKDIYVTPFNQLPPYIMNFIDYVTTETESITGINPANSQTLGSTATATQGLLGSIAKRELAIIKNIADGLKRILLYWHEYNSVFLDERTAVRILDTKEFKAINREDLLTTIDVELEISTPELNDITANNIAFLLQTTAQTGDPDVTNMLKAELFKLRNKPHLADKIMNYKPKMSPIEELQIKRLEAEIADIQARAGENEVDAQLKQAKAASEQAKAKNLEATANLHAATADKITNNTDAKNTLSALEMEYELEIAALKIKHQQEMEKIITNLQAKYEADELKFKNDSKAFFAKLQQESELTDKKLTVDLEKIKLTELLRPKESQN